MGVNRVQCSQGDLEITELLNQPKTPPRTGSVCIPGTKEHRSLSVNPAKVDPAPWSRREDKMWDSAYGTTPAPPKSSCGRYSVLLKFSDLLSVAVSRSEGQSPLHQRAAAVGGEGVPSPSAGLRGPAGDSRVARPQHRSQKQVAPLEIMRSVISPAVSITCKMQTCKGRFTCLYLGEKTKPEQNPSPPT